LAKTIAPDIEIYRFDINEDWRAGVRVVRRERVNAWSSASPAVNCWAIINRPLRGRT